MNVTASRCGFRLRGLRRYRVVVGHIGVRVTAIVPAWIGVDQRARKVGHLVEQCMAGSLGDRVSIADSKVLIDGDLGLGVETMADPTQADTADVLDAFHLAKNFLGLGDDRRIDRVHDSEEDVAGGVAQDEHDHQRDDEPGERVGSREAQEYADRAREDAQRGEAIRPGMEAVRDEGG
jgi:hypothetical protein